MPREAANAEAEAAEAAGAGSRITVAADAADAYFLIRGFQARLAFAREQVATDQRLLELVRLRFARDVASDREVAQSEALLAQARSTVPLLLSGLEAQLNRADVLMGDQPGTHAAELAREAAIPAIPTIPRGDEPVDVLRRRPDVIAAERRLAASNARIGAALGEYYPKLSIAGLLGFEEESDVDHLFRSATFQPQGIAGLRWRLFDFGKIDAEVRGARGAEAKALGRLSTVDPPRGRRRRERVHGARSIRQGPNARARERGQRLSSERATPPKPRIEEESSP